ncbi:LuxR family transcriptional regulator [Mycobacterium shimoidei]|nr:LuxR family transcriptional regulator [Mycobacterium shimoidei]
MLASMIERADTPPVNWSDVGINELPSGTVTLLLADVEGSTQLWETQPDDMSDAFTRLDHALTEVIAAHDGVRPVEQGEGDSFVVAFPRASDAIACALALQRAPLAPIRLRIGVHSGEIQLRDEANYIGPTINRTARIRDLAHGGQTVLSGVTEALAADRLPADVWLTELGSYPLRGVARPERVLQLCHPDLRNEFPPLRTSSTVAVQQLPVQLTTFIGRVAEIKKVRGVLTDNRLVTLTGAGGAGKTRLAVQVAAQMANEFGDGVWYVDLAAITNPDVVPVATARALGLPDQPGRSTMDTLIRTIGDKQILVVLDNCEHLLDVTATLTMDLLGACPNLSFLATSREPIAVDGEVIWRVPSLSLDDEAIDLFVDRARRARPDFAINDDNRATVEEICRRLDGMPLAIELAAAQVRALSLDEILAGLHDRFRLLAGGARRSVRRQQTLHASVDWSHALLTDPERVLFRRLAAFMGGFDLDAARAVASGGPVQSHHILDQLTLLVDKSLVVAENTTGRTRYRLLEMVRQYALEKLSESGEADAVRARHRDHYTAMGALLDNPTRHNHQQLLEQAESEIDNLRAAFGWSLENSDAAMALQLASSLQPLWLARGRIQEGLAWLDAALADQCAADGDDVSAARARALAEKALLNSWAIYTFSIADAEEALTAARRLEDPRLLCRALTARGAMATFDAEQALSYFGEAIELARKLDDRWTLSHILGLQAYAGFMAGDPRGSHAAGEEGRDLADSVGDRFGSRFSRCWGLAASQMMLGQLAAAATQCDKLVAEADADGDLLNRYFGLIHQVHALAYLGRTAEARATADAAIETGAELGPALEGIGYLAVAIAALAAGDVAEAAEANKTSWQRVGMQAEASAIQLWRRAEAALAANDLIEARGWADEAVSGTKGCQRMLALATRAHVATAEGALRDAERDARNVLEIAVDVESQIIVPDMFELLAALSADAGSHIEAARLLGAADAIRNRTGAVRFKVHDARFEAALTTVRNALGQPDFDAAWAEGAALSTEEAIAYALRGHGERKRPSNGWAALTPTELDVVRLVSEGLPNKDIAARLFVSPRTVQTHLTHVYTKLGLTSRVQLAQEAAQHT